MAQHDAMQRLEDYINLINEAEEPREDLILTLKEFRSEDLAAVWHHLKPKSRVLVFNSFDDERAAALLVELDDIFAIEMLGNLTPERIASILNYLPPDEGADVIGLSEEEDQPEILTHLADTLADQLRDLVTYGPETAGGLMTSSFVEVAGTEMVRSALLKVKTSEEAETINYIFVTDEEGRLSGVISLRDLLQADLNQKVSAIMEKDIITVPLDMDQEEVTRIANKYHFHSLPVVDDLGVLKGIVTFDDLMEVLEDESSEDMYRMAGEVALHPTQQPVWRRVLARLPWLLVTLGGTVIAAGMIRIFELLFNQHITASALLSLEELSGAVLSKIDSDLTFLLYFLPMIGGMAGNVGLQSSTVMVRGLATGEVESPYFLKILFKEVLIAATIGLISGLIICGLIAGVFELRYGVVVGLSLFSAILSAAFLGTMMPFLCLLLLRVDPAYASGPLLTTLNDIFGILIYFGIAAVLLNVV